MGPLVFRDGSFPALLFGDPPAFPCVIVFPPTISHSVSEFPQKHSTFLFLIVLSSMMRHDVFISAAAVGHILLEAGIGARFVGFIERAKFHVVT